jgi:hypothetical protein
MSKEKRNEIRIESWNELQDELYADAWQPELNRFRSPFAFRGTNGVEQSLETSLARLGGDFVKLERHLLRNFRKYARRDSVEHDTLWNWLALAKHHGLPTRLLDWSFSPFVAMHFATSNLNRYDEDATIWAVRFVQVHDLLPENARASLDDQSGSLFTVEMLAEAIPDPLKLSDLSDEDFVIFFEPPSIDERIVNQFALFSVMSDPEGRLELWLAEHPQLYKKIVIPAGLKWEIRDKLDQANVTERVLFPGLDGISRWLTRHYNQRRDDVV